MLSTILLALSKLNVQHRGRSKEVQLLENIVCATGCMKFDFTGCMKFDNNLTTVY
jgi:hypothetical protein